MNDDEKETYHDNWYEPKLISFKEFLDEIKMWMNGDPDAQKGKFYSACDTESKASHDRDVGSDDSVSQTVPQKISKVSERLSGTTAKPLSKVASKAPSNVSKVSSA